MKITFTKARLGRLLRSVARLRPMALLVKPLVIIGLVASLALTAGGFAGWQNYRAVSLLHSAQQADRTGNYTEARARLRAINRLFLVPSVAKRVQAEKSHNQTLLATAQKLAEVQQLLKAHKTQQALDLLKMVQGQPGDSSSAIQTQVAQLQKSAQTQAAASAAVKMQTSTTVSSTSSGTKAGGGSGATGGGQTSGGTQPPAFNGNLSGCPGTLTQAGAYTLTTDLAQTTPSSSCINAANLSGVSVDCAGHSITVSAGPVPINFYNSANFTLKNCHLSNQVGFTVSSGTVSGNTWTFGRGSGQALDFYDMTGTSFTNNTITNGVIILKAGSTGNTLTGNNINADPSITAAGVSGIVEVDDSGGNTISSNHLDGGWHGVPNQGPGADDGVMLKSSSNSTVSYNTISNVFDCGIETIAQASNDHIIGNAISSAGICGVGSFYYTSWLNNVVQSNTASQTKILFQLYIDTNYPLTAQETPSTYYFQGNQFTSNTFSSGTASNSNSANINFGSQFVPAGITVQAGNDQFKNNNFGTFDSGPNLQPQSAIVDLGGNQCAAIPASDPQSITCN